MRINTRVMNPTRHQALRNENRVVFLGAIHIWISVDHEDGQNLGIYA